jgi:hypothetical protein
MLMLTVFCAAESADIVDKLALSSHHIVAVKADGTVIFFSNEDYGKCDVSEWTDIAVTYSAMYCTTAIDTSGNVHAIGEYDNIYSIDPIGSLDWNIFE